jgi:hypothetical protein
MAAVVIQQSSASLRHVMRAWLLRCGVSLKLQETLHFPRWAAGMYLICSLALASRSCRVLSTPAAVKESVAALQQYALHAAVTVTASSASAARRGRCPHQQLLYVGMSLYSNSALGAPEGQYACTFAIAIVAVGHLHASATLATHRMRALCSVA